jgi:hypothetical protein
VALGVRTSSAFVDDTDAEPTIVQLEKSHGNGGGNGAGDGDGVVEKETLGVGVPDNVGVGDGVTGIESLGVCVPDDVGVEEIDALFDGVRAVGVVDIDELEELEDGGSVHPLAPAGAINPMGHGVQVFEPHEEEEFAGHAVQSAALSSE